MFEQVLRILNWEAALQHTPQAYQACCNGQSVGWALVEGVTRGPWSGAIGFEQGFLRGQRVTPSAEKRGVPALDEHVINITQKLRPLLK